MLVFSIILLILLLITQMFIESEQEKRYHDNQSVIEEENLEKNKAGTEQNASMEQAQNPGEEIANEKQTGQEKIRSQMVDEIVPPQDFFYEDWNNDGLKDLVREEIDGKWHVFPNYGTDENPVYNESYAYKNE